MHKLTQTHTHALTRTHAHTRILEFRCILLLAIICFFSTKFHLKLQQSHRATVGFRFKQKGKTCFFQFQSGLLGSLDKSILIRVSSQEIKSSNGSLKSFCSTFQVTFLSLPVILRKKIAEQSCNGAGNLFPTVLWPKNRNFPPSSSISSSTCASPASFRFV